MGDRRDRQGVRWTENQYRVEVHPEPGRDCGRQPEPVRWRLIAILALWPTHCSLRRWTHVVRPHQQVRAHRRAVRRPNSARRSSLTQLQDRCGSKLLSSRERSEPRTAPFHAAACVSWPEPLFGHDVEHNLQCVDDYA